MDKSIAITQLKKHMGLTVSDEAITTTIWLTQKEAEKLIELLRIELACSKKENCGGMTMKNIDKIRAMSVEELAEFRVNTTQCQWCVFHKTDYCDDENCVDGVEEWLSMEHISQQKR